MAVSRRAFVRSLTPRVAPSSASIAARGREAWAAEHAYGEEPQAAQEGPPALRLNSNENPLGPGQSALGAIERAFAYAGRYPMNARPSMADFRTLVAKRNGLKIENVGLGAGSGEILECAVMAFASKSRGVVSAAPTFESPGRTARRRRVSAGRGSSRRSGQARSRKNGRGVNRRRPRLRVQSEQPHGRGARSGSRLRRWSRASPRLRPKR